MHGAGKMIYENGDVFTGQFVDGMKSGQGSLVLASGKGTYVGEFEDDEMHGNGCFTMEDGSEYFGEFRDGVQHGEGMLTTSDGTEMYG